METIKTSPNVEFDVIYADGTRKRVTKGILYEAEPSGDMIFHNGTEQPAVLLAAAETALVSLLGISPGLEALAMGMALGEESRAALETLAKFTVKLLDLGSEEQQAIFRLGQKDMQASAVTMLQDAAAKMAPGSPVGNTLIVAAEMVQGMGAVMPDMSATPGRSMAVMSRESHAAAHGFALRYINERGLILISVTQKEDQYKVFFRRLTA